jgi:hypothetical protein
LRGSGVVIITGAAVPPIAGRYGCRDAGTTTTIIITTGTTGTIATTTIITTTGTAGITTTATVGIATNRRSLLTAVVQRLDDGGSSLRKARRLAMNRRTSFTKMVTYSALTCCSA